LHNHHHSHQELFRRCEHNGLDLTSAVKALSTAVPTSVLTATATGVAPSGTAKPIPEGFTLEDCLDWIDYVVSNAGKQ
ncbi:hypothetical protein KCU89_g19046, partial [Aureobasidium melanogenum]